MPRWLPVKSVLSPRNDAKDFPLLGQVQYNAVLSVRGERLERTDVKFQGHACDLALLSLNTSCD